MTAPNRHYIEVEGRRVLYRRVGAGAPLVMLHGSPGNSAMLEQEMAACAAHFTCIALDTPGFGGSDALPGDPLTMSEVAAATAAAIQALGLAPCLVYGTHTGALIAAELGAGWPELVTGLVMEGLPIFTDAEIEAIFTDDYFTKLIPDPLGSHLVSTWMRFRDQFTWFPWFARRVDRLNPVDRPSAEDIHLWVMMFYRSAGGYRPVYRAACFHGQRSREAAARLTVPAVFMASAEDMLYPHLERLPPLKAEQRIEALPYDPAGKFEAIAAMTLSLPQPLGACELPRFALAGSDPAIGFLDTPGGQVFVRTYGGGVERTIILLHDAPGSGLAMEETARALAHDARVIVPDLPGCGESDDPASPDVLAASAEAVRALIDVLALDRVSIGALGCGGAVAALLVDDPRVAAIVLDGPRSPDPAVAAAIAPDLPLAPDGSHWLKAWLMVRDGEIYAPWYDGSVTAQRRAQGDFDAGRLHARTVEIMKARASYHRLPRAAWSFDPAAALARATVPFREASLSTLIGDRP